jgi:UDP-N-acetylmuramoyl-tripeptide--D-alanyl-D-alanine ligase
MSDQMLWTWPDLCRALGLDECAGPGVARVVVDSRGAAPGDLFVALPGDPGPRFNPSHRSDVDGHDFVDSAVASGAVGALVHRQVESPAPTLLVSDTYDGLWALGHAARKRLEGDVVAVTGSSGKTTFKTFLAAALGGYAPPGSFNNHIGVPLSLANATLDCDAWVFEIGTNHPGEIAPLAAMVDPDVAVVLNVHNAHIENFENRDALIDEKLSLFSKLRDNSIKVCEESLASRVAGRAYTFGADIGADARGLDLKGDRLHADVLGRRIEARVPGGGAHRAQTVLAVVLVTALLERDLTRACDLPSSLVPAGRGNLVVVGGVEITDDSYNANPSSMAGAIEAFLSAPARGHARNIGVIGQMAELGKESEAAHAGIAGLFERFDIVFAVGDEFAHWLRGFVARLVDAVNEAGVSVDAT